MKQELRRINKIRRNQMSKTEVSEKSQAAAELFLNSTIYRNAENIMLYIPLGNETDTREIIKRAYADKKRCIFPVTDEETGIITPCAADEEAQFEKGAFSVFEPSEKRPVRPEELDVVIVPGIAFDKKGARVGFGKGCYDRLLAGLDVIKVGYCYGFQVCDEIASEKHDIKMDFLITESGLIKCE